MSYYKDFIDVKEWDEVMKDPRFQAYAAGFDKAKEVFTRPKGQLAFLTHALDHFIMWKEEQDAGDQRVDL